MTNKYSEGLPGARYYGGNEFIDQAERLCQVSLVSLRSHATLRSAAGYTFKRSCRLLAAAARPERVPR